MLIVWHGELIVERQRAIVTLDSRASFWPRAWHYASNYNAAVPSEWWISFSQGKLGLIWTLRWPDHVEIVYRD